MTIKAGKREPLYSFPPLTAAHGTSIRWRRFINGSTYTFTHVTMPDGETRWFASKLTGDDPRFGCCWTPVLSVIWPRS